LWFLNQAFQENGIPEPGQHPADPASGPDLSPSDAAPSNPVEALITGQERGTRFVLHTAEEAFVLLDAIA
jgi:hypothetical protein